ncbi:hypothetical protein JCM9140_4614 [Halalkalibacter wakoensis JCM 9140]|uniref:Rv2525c-like glycoside hydrolase-like domain-containing protein n=1 Tax=Halalkalibacter wakoensis JCM 9140 TaxID=1236970 RepID=W4Q8K7_9BACI|nr:glycoside hydrolase domain-containing protein [Halalkalibacter wakoensis]GAE28391.1 hypothetical protein JCM9140_4614 [Halalkalibacter wakoensis JCM 9140]
MKRKVNVSFIVLGVVSLLFLISLTFFSEANTQNPASASTDSEVIQSDEDQDPSSDNDGTSSEEGDIQNNVDNTIEASDGDVTNTVTNDIHSSHGQVENQIENHIHSNAGSINNTVDNNIEAESGDLENTIDNQINGGDGTISNQIGNDIRVSVDVTITNDINNSITAHSEDGENGESNGNGGNGEENGNGENGSDNGDENGNGNGENGSDNGETPETVWGVDSASITTDEMLACVRDNFGDPEIWGRYLGTNEGASYGLTAEEVELLHAEDIQILVVYNHFNDGTGYDHGQYHANEAIEMARDFGIPEGVALFANVEPIYPIDSDFIQGWHDAVTESEYSSGIYGVFDPGQEVYMAFEAAAEADPSILEEMHIWTAAPNEGITTEDNAPAYNPSYPDGALIGGWQYGLDAETCNIDTNIFDGNVLDVLW